MNVGITGAKGLLGFHHHCFFYGQPDTKVIPADRHTFSTPSKLRDFVKQCDVILHFAGMNRGPDQIVASTNIELTLQLVEALNSQDNAPHVFFASSTHIYKGTEYGNSKKACGEMLVDWAKNKNAAFTNLILPHVYGECGKPFYNSAISTFCHQLAHDEAPKIENDSELELVHAQEVAKVIGAKTTGEVRVNGTKIKVSEALARLQSFKEQYSALVVPDVRSEFDLHLFNTYRSYLYPGHYPVSLTLHTDTRGGLFEAVKSHNGGQSFISTTKPGVTRGNHYHLSKIERFCVLSGKAVIRIRKMFTNEIKTFEVSGTTPQFIDIPTLHTHNITNTGDDTLTTLFWSHEIYDPKRPDTIAEPVGGHP